MSEKEINDLCEVALESNVVDGLILTNTTISRDMLYSKPIKNSWKIDESGGFRAFKES